MQSPYARAILVSSLFIALGAFAHPARVQCQWNTSGNNISNSNTGNVGVGTASPIEALHVAKGDANGTVAIFQKDTSSSAVAISTTNNKGSVSGTNSNATAPGDLLLNPFGGNVGIGTTSPAQKLAVEGAVSIRPSTAHYFTPSAPLHVFGIPISARTDSSVQEVLTLSQSNNATGGGGYFSKGSHFSIGLSFWEDPTNNYPRTRVDFRTTGRTTDTETTPNTVMSLRDDGNVGIGTTAPSSRLVVASGSGYNYFLNSATGVGDLWGFSGVNGRNFGINVRTPNTGDLITHLGINYAINGANGITPYTITGAKKSPVIELNAEDGSVSLYGENGSGTDWRSPVSNLGLSVRGNGYVGVGMSTANYRLDVNGEINATGLRINGTPISSGGSQWSGSGPIYYTGGNVGIGTNNPTDRLTVYRNDNNAYLRVSAPLSYQSAIGFSDDTNGQDSVIYRPGSTRDLAFYTTTAGNAMYLTQAGNIGIGTTTPSTKLQVSAGDSSFALFGPNTTWGGSLAVGSGAAFVSPIAARAQVLSSNGNLHLDAGTGQNVYISWLTQSNTIINGQSGNVGIGTTSPGSGYKLDVNGNTNVTGNLNITGTVNAKYQDVAEWVPSSAQLAAGTVVVLDQTKSNQVTSSTTAYDTRVAGVISAQPGITLGERSDSKVLVATTGRVRVKVDASRGPIAIGDLLVTSDVPGVAMKSIPVEFAGRKMHMPGTIIGKALEPLEKGKGEILVLLSLQ